MAFRVLGLRSSDAQPIQLVGPTVSAISEWVVLPNVFSIDYLHTGHRMIVAFPDVLNGRMKLFAFTGQPGSGLTAGNLPLYQSYAGLAKMAISGASGTFTNGETILGASSGATARIVNRLPPGGTFTAYSIDTIAGGPFTLSETITGQSSGVTATVGVVSGGSVLGDSWAYVAAITYLNGAGSRDQFGGALVKGFWPILDGTTVKLALVSLFTSAGGTAKVSVYNPLTDTWSMNQATTGTNYEYINSYTLRAAMHKGILYIPACYDRNSVLPVDVVNKSKQTILAQINIEGTERPSTGVFIARGTVYYTISTTNTTIVLRKRLPNGTFVESGTLHTHGSGVSNIKTLVFEAPNGDLLALISRSDSTTVLLKITNDDQGALATTDMTAYLPAGYSTMSAALLYLAVDRVTNGPDGTPIVMVYFQLIAGNIACARVDAADVWTDLGSSAGGAISAFSDASDGAGEVCYDTDAKFVYHGGDFVRKVGGQEFSFYPFGGGTCGVSLLVQRNALTPAQGVGPDYCHRGTLSTPSEGTLVDSNKRISGVSANGAKKTAIWVGGDDGFSVGDFVERQIYVHVS